jgi:RNA polymerase sigma-B factor
VNDLTKRREAHLFEKVRQTGDPSARETLIRRYLPLARHTAHRFRQNGDSLEDLFQVACYALVKAIDKFDPARGLAFSSYAVPTMTGELKRHRRDTGWGMRVSRGLQERVLDVERAVARLTTSDGSSPSVARIAGDLGLPTEEVLEALEAATNHRPESLDTPRASDEPESGSRFETVGEEDPLYELVDDIHTVGPAVRELPDRERTILALRFFDELPQREIAARLGISQMHVSRLLRRTLDSLREQLEGSSAHHERVACN